MLVYFLHQVQIMKLSLFKSNHGLPSFHFSSQQRSLFFSRFCSADKLSSVFLFSESVLEHSGTCPSIFFSLFFTEDQVFIHFSTKSKMFAALHAMCTQLMLKIALRNPFKTCDVTESPSTRGPLGGSGGKVGASMGFG